jgi:hypothetical protein
LTHFSIRSPFALLFAPVFDPLPPSAAAHVLVTGVANPLLSVDLQNEVLTGFILIFIYRYFEGFLFSIGAFQSFSSADHVILPDLGLVTQKR